MLLVFFLLTLLSLFLLSLLSLLPFLLSLLCLPLSLSPLLFCSLPLLLSLHYLPLFLLLPPSRFIPLLLLLSPSSLTPLAPLPILLRHFHFRRQILHDSSTILRMRRWRDRFMRDCVAFCGVRPQSRYLHGEEPPLASRSAMHAIAPTRSMRDYSSSSLRNMETTFLPMR